MEINDNVLNNRARNVSYVENIYLKLSVATVMHVQRYVITYNFHNTRIHIVHTGLTGIVSWKFVCICLNSMSYMVYGMCYIFKNTWE